MKNQFKRVATEVTIIAVLATLAVVYEKNAAHLGYKELTALAIAVIAVWLLVAASAAWFFSRPREILDNLRSLIETNKKEGERMHFELKATLREALERQPYVDEDMLSIIEAHASTIWVISTDLINDINPGRIRESVEENIKNGKTYTYFVPSASNPNFPDAALHERAYKSWDVYQRHRDQVRFIHLPDDTLFLFREVVIYNPLTDPNSKDEMTTPKGFTYFEIMNEGNERLSPRLMKIPDSYLQFLKGQLHRYSENIGLVSEVERLIPELRKRLSREDLGYLGSLIGERRIEDRSEFRKFLNDVRERDPAAATLLEKTLGRYIDLSA